MPVSGLSKTKRVVSGMRPTGRLHIGHYFGALQNWIRLQDDPEFECFYFVADWHALTSDYADSSQVAQNTIEIVTDYLAAGLDPKKSVIFQQSLVPEHAELHLLLSMVTPLSWLERVPTYKEAFENVQDKDLHTYGFLGYPCLQTADIVIYSNKLPLYVPVGEDQVSHVELSREIVRKFNFHFGLDIDVDGMIRAQNSGNVDERTLVFLIRDGLDRVEAGGAVGSKFSQLGTVPNAEIHRMALRIRQLAASSGLINLEQRLQNLEDNKFTNDFQRFVGLHGAFKKFVHFADVLTEPSVLLTKTPRIPGLDGRKMSKSYGNAITLSESDDDIRKKTKVMVTDPARKRRTDPGNPDVCPVYDWHKLFSPQETLDWAAHGCRTAEIGCIECKSKMADHLIQWIAPVRERRLEYEKHPARVLEIIDAGSKLARAEAQATMSRVREAVFGWDKKRKEIGSDGSQ